MKVGVGQEGEKTVVQAVGEGLRSSPLYISPLRQRPGRQGYQQQRLEICALKMMGGDIARMTIEMRNICGCALRWERKWIVGCCVGTKRQ